MKDLGKRTGQPDPRQIGGPGNPPPPKDRRGSWIGRPATPPPPLWPRGADQKFSKTTKTSQNTQCMYSGSLFFPMQLAGFCKVIPNTCVLVLCLLAMPSMPSTHIHVSLEYSHFLGVLVLILWD